MADAPLSQREFDTWRESDNEFKTRMTEHIEQQGLHNIALERRMTVVEVLTEETRRTSKRYAAIIGGAVSAVVGGLVAFFSGR